MADDGDCSFVLIQGTATVASEGWSSLLITTENAGGTERVIC